MSSSMPNLLSNLSLLNSTTVKSTAQPPPPSQTVTTTTYIWPLEKFSQLSSTRYDSPIFSLPSNNKISFFLAIHPKGSPSFWNQTHTLLYLYLKSCDDRRELLVDYKISLLDAKGVKHNTQEGKAKFTKLTKWTMEYNWQYNVLRDYLLNSARGLLQDDRLSIHCEVNILDNDSTKSAKKINEAATIRKVSEDLHCLMKEQKLCDVTLVLGSGSEFKCHKVILAARSPVFSAMFEHQETIESQENRVEITDVPVEVCEPLLEYIYTGRIPPLEQFAPELLSAADKYQIDCLKSICEQHLCTSLSIESVSHLLLLADMHHAVALKKKCIEQITSYPTQVMATEGWKVLSSARPELGLQLFQHLATKKVVLQTH